MGTAVVLIILCIVVGFAIRSILRNKKKVKFGQCHGDCSHCSGTCHES